jgi:hypothetical protein
MARRSRQSFLKRQRERQRAEKAAEKRLKRFARRSGIPPEEADEEPRPTVLGAVEEDGSAGTDPEAADETSDPAEAPLDKQD